MLIKINNIPESGLDLEVPFSAPLLSDAIAGVEGDAARSKATARLVLTKSDDNILLAGTIDGSIHLSCVRCLAEVVTPLQVPVRMIFTPEEELDEEDEDDSAEADLDHAPYEGNAIELDPVLREALILALPMTPFCKPNCLGLCTVCGGNRNEKPCNCSIKIEDPRLSALKGLKV